jgi:predicted class III extradiol MEMO1 family dioxygenase
MMASNREHTIEEQGIVFKASLRKGVPYVPQWMVNAAQKIAKKTGRSVVDMTGDFQRTLFIVDRPYSPEEAEE